MLSRIAHYWRRENWPWWVIVVVAVISGGDRVIGWLDNIGFLVSNADRLNWADDVFFHPGFTIVALIVGFGGLLIFGGRPPPESSAQRPTALTSSATGTGKRAVATRPATTGGSRSQDSLRAIPKSGAQTHKKLRSGSIEFLYGAHEKSSGISIKLRIQLPDGRWVSTSDSVVPGIFYYPIRFVYPDDFEGMELQKGTYHVAWLRATSRMVSPPPLDPNSAYIFPYMMNPREVIDENVVSTEEFKL
jgi:hypothetical protein